MAVNCVIGWRAYIGQCDLGWIGVEDKAEEEDGIEKIMSFGSKLSEKVARAIFPDIKGDYDV